MNKLFGIAFGIVFGVSVLSLGGCSISQEKTNMDFDQAYSVFVDGLFSSDAFALADVMKEDKTKDKLMLSMNGGNKDMDLDVTLDISSLTNIQSGDSQTMADFKIDRYDKLKQLPLKISGVLEFLFMNQNLYAQIHNFDMDSGPGSSEASLIKLIVDNYLETRILMDDPNTIDLQHVDASVVASSYQLPQRIKELLYKHKIFEEKEKFNLDGKDAYRVDLDKNAFEELIIEIDNTKLLKEAMFSSGVDLGLDAYLLIEDENNVKLVFSLGGDLSYDISGEVAARSLLINIENKLNNKKSKLSLIEKRSKIQLNIDITNETEEQTSVSLTILPTQTDLGLDLSFDGELQISPMQFYDPVVLDLEGTYLVEKADFDNFTVPENPLLLHQLLGDQFALPSMIMEE